MHSSLITGRSISLFALLVNGMCFIAALSTPTLGRPAPSLIVAQRTVAGTPITTPVRAPTAPTDFPTSLDLISSSDPAKWTRLVDLTCRLPAEVQEFNAANPNAKITLLGKCEFSNPGMSHKDRIAKAMLQEAEARGDLTGPDGEKKTILAASSGNTGCSLALVGTLMGYEVVIITNDKCSIEKRTHIQSNGATLWMAEDLPEMFPDELMGETDYMKQEDLLAEASPSRFFAVNQYNNLDNAQAHFKTTGKEIWEQTNGKVTHFVMGGSTGGSIMGVGRLLKSKAQTTKIVLADPEKSYLGALVEGRDGGEAVGAAAVEKVKGLLESTGEIELEGVGKACLTGIMKSGGSSPSVLKFVDFSVPVNDFDAFDECHATAAAGFMVGGSSGMNICASRVVASQCAAEPPREGGVTIVTLLCDHGIKYMSKVYNQQWLKENDTRQLPKVAIIA